jgi:hypothetical protein
MLLIVILKSHFVKSRSFVLPPCDHIVTDSACRALPGRAASGKPCRISPAARPGSVSVPAPGSSRRACDRGRSAPSPLRLSGQGAYAPASVTVRKSRWLRPSHEIRRSARPRDQVQADREGYRSGRSGQVVGFRIRSTCQSGELEPRGDTEELCEQWCASPTRSCQGLWPVAPNGRGAWRGNPWAVAHAAREVQGMV